MSTEKFKKIQKNCTTFVQILLFFDRTSQPKTALYGIVRHWARRGLSPRHPVCFDRSFLNLLSFDSWEKMGSSKNRSRAKKRRFTGNQFCSAGDQAAPVPGIEPVAASAAAGDVAESASYRKLAGDIPD